MAILDIVKYPDPVLREISHKVADPGSLRQLVNDMEQTMYASSGAGLAAIQVAQPVAMFIIDPTIGGGDEQDPPLVFINPEILELGEVQESKDEGCLSFPGIYVQIPRSQQVRVRATNLDGEPYEVQAEGLYARAIQHENDHLNGRLIADFVGRIKRGLMKRQIARAEAED